jgi:hypothetical protein
MLGTDEGLSKVYVGEPGEGQPVHFSSISGAEAVRVVGERSSADRVVHLVDDRGNPLRRRNVRKLIEQSRPAPVPAFELPPPSPPKVERKRKRGSGYWMGVFNWLVVVAVAGGHEGAGIVILLLLLTPIIAVPLGWFWRLIWAFR